MATSSSSRGPIVVMGVAGSGKTTLGLALAAREGLRFVDADDHHPPSNKSKMAAGIPLDDDDRAPWLAALAALLAASTPDARIVLACSALRRQARAILRAAGGPHLRFVHLNVPVEVLARRLTQRSHHFFAPDLLASQLAALEAPGEDEALIVNVTSDDTPDALTSRVAAALDEERLLV